jgi:hypothetical protein
MSDTPAAELVQEYLRLGGTRKSANDDNRTSTRKWDSEPPEAEEFWKRKVEPLSDTRRSEIETLLPSISDSDR